MTWQGAAWVALGGAIGSVLRWIAVVIAVQRLGAGFPWGTLAVNVAGSFAIGALAEWAAGGFLGVTPTVRLFVATGVLGGFTTFSSFSLDALTLLRDGDAPLALGYAAGSVLLGLTAAYAGMIAARLVTPHG